MSMGADDDLEAMAGTLLKVLHVDEDNGVLHARSLDGRILRVSGFRYDFPERGDVVLVGNGGWQIAPAEVWVASSSVATVRQVIEDGTVLIDDGLGIRTLRNPGRVKVEADNAIEYNDADGVIRVLSPTPLRSRRFSQDSDQGPDDYLVAAASDGPTFADFGGYPDVIKRARELIETQFKRRRHLDQIKARPVKGVLFSGPPGTGKTHLARIIAHESKADFYLVSGPSVVSKWLGETEDILRRIFDAARESRSGRAIVFFDEIDSIAERRTGDTHEASKRLVAQLLTLMDGFDEQGRSVVVIAATNRVEALDPALTRPGRFDWEIEFGMPDVSDRLAILKVATRGLNVAVDLPLSEVAKATEGWSAAQLGALWAEAALVAAGDRRGRIEGEDLAQAFERVSSRPRRSSREAHE